jgi:uncharacterized protein YjbI with pentapeptide repeats
MEYSNLRDSSFINADLSYTDFKFSDLSGCDLRGANLTDAKLDNADLHNVITDENTIGPYGEKGYKP